MQIHQLQPLHSVKKKKPRVGRGGKRGTTSGRGTKGQKSRSGHRIRPAERDFIQRLPKLRGFRNKPKGEKPQIVQLRDLQNVKGEIPIRIDDLAEAGLVNISKGRRVKVLGSGLLTKPIVLRGIKVSKSVRRAIEAAGGKIT